MVTYNLYQIQPELNEDDFVYVVAASIRDALAKYKVWLANAINADRAESDTEPPAEPSDLPDPEYVFLLTNEYSLVL